MSQMNLLSHNSMISCRIVADKMQILILNAAALLQEKLLIGRNIRVKFLTCGRLNCSCKIGKRHGPYYYVRKKVGAGYVDKYVKRETIKDWQAKYEMLGDNVLFDVLDLSQIPSEFLKYPTFKVDRRLDTSSESLGNVS